YILHMIRRPDLFDLARRQHFLILVPRHWRLAGIDFFHGDALAHGADQAAQVAADADLFFDRKAIDRVAAGAGQHFEPPGSADLLLVAVGSHVLGHRQLLPADRLVGAVLAGDVAQAAMDALVLVDLGDDLVVEVQVAPGLDAGDRLADEIAQPLEPLLAHPVFQAAAELLDDPEPVVHD